MAGNPMVFSEANDIPEELPDARKFVTRYAPRPRRDSDVGRKPSDRSGKLRQVPRDSESATTS